MQHFGFLRVKQNRYKHNFHPDSSNPDQQHFWGDTRKLQDYNITITTCFFLSRHQQIWKKFFARIYLQIPSIMDVHNLTFWDACCFFFSFIYCYTLGCCCLWFIRRIELRVMLCSETLWSKVPSCLYNLVIFVHNCDCTCGVVCAFPVFLTIDWWKNEWTNCRVAVVW